MYDESFLSQRVTAGHQRSTARSKMGDEDEQPAAAQTAMVFGAGSFIGDALAAAMAKAGYQTEAATAGSDVLGADVIVCNVYGLDPVHAKPPLPSGFATVG